MTHIITTPKGGTSFFTGRGEEKCNHFILPLFESVENKFFFLAIRLYIYQLPVHLIAFRLHISINLLEDHNLDVLVDQKTCYTWSGSTCDIGMGVGSCLK